MSRPTWGQSLAVAGAMTAATLIPAAAGATPLVAPFDFSRSTISLDVSVRGVPLRMFLDTGVSPSVIDTARANALGLKVNYAGGGEASGDGDARSAIVYPTLIDNLTIKGRAFGDVKALTLDMSAVSGALRRPVDGILGHSFLTGKLVLIDYPSRTVTIFDDEAESAAQLATCRKAWLRPLRSFDGDKIPVVELKIGSVLIPVSIDTGSNGNMSLFKRALEESAVSAAMVETGSTTSVGARGAYTEKVYRMNAPISLGPFTLPAGEEVALDSKEGAADTRLANVGNQLLASMQLKLLLDYRKSRLGFFGDCAS